VALAAAVPSPHGRDPVGSMVELTPNRPDSAFEGPCWSTLCHERVFMQSWRPRGPYCGSPVVVSFCCLRLQQVATNAQRCSRSQCKRKYRQIGCTGRETALYESKAQRIRLQRPVQISPTNKAHTAMSLTDVLVVWISALGHFSLQTSTQVL